MLFFFFKQKTAYEVRISDWSSDVCSSDLKDVTLRKGPFGIYLQLGEAEGDDKPKRASLPKGLAPAEVDLAKGLALLALPREIGSHPEDGKPITDRKSTRLNSSH